MMLNKKKTVLGACRKSVPLAIALGLAACGGSSQTDQSEGATRIGTHPVFDAVGRQFPLNIDLLFADAAGSDGTANVGVPGNAVEAAINVLDGFSTSAYFDIAFAGGSVDPDSLCTLTDAQLKQLCDAPNIFLLPLNTGDKDALDPANVNAESPFLQEAIGPYTASVVSLDGGQNNVLRVIPERPLQAKTKYLVALSDGIKNQAGEPITPSSGYQSLRQDGPITADLVPVRAAVKGWDALAGGFLAASSEGALGAKNVALAYTFTTTDPIAPLVAMAAPRAALIKQLVSEGLKAKIAEIVTEQMATEEVQSQIAALVESGKTPEEATATVQKQVAEQVKEQHGDQITAELMAKVPGLVDQLDGALSQAREGVGLPTPQPREVGMITMLPPAEGESEPRDLGVDPGDFFELEKGVVKAYTGYIKLPYYLTTPDTTATASYTLDAWEPDHLLGGMLSANLPEGAPSLPPQDLDGSFNVTYRYPFAEQQSLESVPLQLTLPMGGHCTSPYKTALYVHGITSDRASAVGLAHSLAKACIATVSIDLPLHGVSSDPESPTYPLNVENMTSPTEDTPPGMGLLLAQLYGDKAPKERHFNDPAGSGGQFINLGTLTNTRDNLRQSVMDLLNLNASLTAINDQLEPRNVSLDLGNVSVVGASLGGIVGTVFTTVNQLAIDAEEQTGSTSKVKDIKGLVVSAGGSQLTQVLNNSATFGPIVRGGLAAEGVMPDTTNYERFLYVAQSTVDSGDPVNFAETLGGLGVPVLVQMVKGDQVVPNGASGAPLAGTQPLACLLFDGALVPGCPSSDSFKVIGDGASHSSLLTPNRPDASDTVELQTQVVQFILGG